MNEYQAKKLIQKRQLNCSDTNMLNLTVLQMALQNNKNWVFFHRHTEIESYVGYN